MSHQSSTSTSTPCSGLRIWTCSCSSAFRFASAWRRCCFCRRSSSSARKNMAPQLEAKKLWLKASCCQKLEVFSEMLKDNSEFSYNIYNSVLKYIANEGTACCFKRRQQSSLGWFMMVLITFPQTLDPPATIPIFNAGSMNPQLCS